MPMAGGGVASLLTAYAGNKSPLPDEQLAANVASPTNEQSASRNGGSTWQKLLISS